MKRISGVYVITDVELMPGRTHAQIAEAALAGGAKIIQIRDKNAGDRDFYEDALELRKLTSDAGAMLAVNDRVDVAAAVGADMVNVGQTDLPMSAARKVLGDNVIIGVSADNEEQALQAQKDGADYVGFGPVFPTETKVDTGPVSGLETLKRVCGEVSIPVVAIGGIGTDNIASVAAAGAACAAVVSAVVCAEDMAEAASELIRKFDSGRGGR